MNARVIKRTLPIIPFLALALVGQAQALTPDQIANNSFQKGFNKAGSFGDSSWGAGYGVAGSVYATPAWVAGVDTLGANGYAYAWGRMNGTYREMLRVQASGYTKAKQETKVDVKAYVAGAQIYSKSWQSATSTIKTFISETPTWNRTFFQTSYSLSVGPIPVTVSAAATGELGYTATGSIDNVGINLGFNPRGKASVNASAGAGGEYCVLGVCVGASAGVYGKLTLLQASLPMTSNVGWSLAPTGGVRVGYKLKGDLSLSSLAGVFGVYAEATLGSSYRWEYPIFSWDGFTTIYPLLDLAGTYCLAGDCSSYASFSTVSLASL